jgi:hypothetical protein
MTSLLQFAGSALSQAIYSDKNQQQTTASVDLKIINFI